jgi:hypothetical protein
METGSVYRARYQMKWAGLILLVMPFAVYHGFKILIHDPIDFWISFFVVGITWTIVIYSYVVGYIWKKIRKRYVDIIVKKIINYHTMCAASLINEDYKRVEFILSKCLERYDSSSIITYFIKGAYTVGTKDLKSLRLFESDLKKLDV